VQFNSPGVRSRREESRARPAVAASGLGRAATAAAPKTPAASKTSAKETKTPAPAAAAPMAATPRPLAGHCIGRKRGEGPVDDPAPSPASAAEPATDAPIPKRPERGVSTSLTVFALFLRPLTGFFGPGLYRGVLLRLGLSPKKPSQKPRPKPSQKQRPNPKLPPRPYRHRRPSLRLLAQVHAFTTPAPHWPLPSPPFRSTGPSAWAWPRGRPGGRGGDQGRG